MAVRLLLPFFNEIQMTLKPFNRQTNFRRQVRAFFNYCGIYLNGNGRRIKYLKKANRFLQLSYHEQKKVQLNRLKAILIDAGEHIPYWRELFQKEHFNPQSFDKLSRLEDLPVLTKEIIQEEGPRLISDEYTLNELKMRIIEGPIGTPMLLWIDTDSFHRQMAINYRGFARLGIRIDDKIAEIHCYNRSSPLNIFSQLSGRLYLNACNASDEKLKNLYQKLKAFQPNVIHGNTSAIFQLALFLTEQQKFLPSIRYVCVTAEKLLSGMRKTIMQAFSAPVFEMYGCDETVRLASECTHGNMHIDMDAAVLELIQDGKQINSDNKILLTTLLNRAMPLIRYDVGDYGRNTGLNCFCGEHSPLIKVGDGKQQQMFQLSSGERIHATYFTRPLYAATEIRSFHIQRTSQNEFEFWVVPWDCLTAQAKDAAMAIAEKCMAGIESSVRIRVRIVDNIPCR